MVYYLPYVIISKVSSYAVLLSKKEKIYSGWRRSNWSWHDLKSHYLNITWKQPCHRKEKERNQIKLMWIGGLLRWSLYPDCCRVEPLFWPCGWRMMVQGLDKTINSWVGLYVVACGCVCIMAACHHRSPCKRCGRSSHHLEIWPLVPRSRCKFAWGGPPASGRQERAQAHRLLDAGCGAAAITNAAALSSRRLRVCLYALSCPTCMRLRLRAFFLLLVVGVGSMP